MPNENPAGEITDLSDFDASRPKGFRARRGLNWGIVGLMYTSFYLCRYNFSIANKSIADEFHFNYTQMGIIISVNMLAYAVGQIVNGLLADKLGGRRAMLIGAAGTIVMNVAFGVASIWGMLGLFVMLRGIDGYLQSFGAPGMIKINVAWFNKRERGQFAGIFGFMINLGRFGIFWIGPKLLVGFMFLGLWQVPALHWRWLFWVPAGVATVVAIALALFVKNSPEEAGFVVADLQDKNLEPHGGAVAGDIGVLDVFVRIASNPVIWFVALAYACTGAVRQSVDQWFPRYMQDVFQTNLKDAHFQWLAFLIPFVASLGSLLSGVASDKIFKGRRAPVAAALYLVETCIILGAAQMTGVNGVIVFFVLIAFTANSTHSLLGTAAAMDIGGKKMAGFASGVIDSFQYFGAGLAGWLLGRLLDSHMGWGGYFYFMAPFGLCGCLMIFAAHKLAKRRGMAL